MSQLRGELKRETSPWREAGGEHHLFGACTPIRDCEPHFHETYIIAFVREGRARTRINGKPVALRAGVALLVNPFDIITAVSDDRFAYDVCYPDLVFMQTALLRATGSIGRPRLCGPRLTGAAASAIGDVLASLSDNADGAAGHFERDLLHLLSTQPDLVEADPGGPERTPLVAQACALIEEHIASAIPIEHICARLGVSRFHLARTFRESIGLPPSIYIRQLRLARALDRVRSGESLAELAHDYEFFDQAHFTREFKRVYGTSPGRLAPRHR